MYKGGTKGFENQNKAFFTNEKSSPTNMKSASPKDALRLMIEYNREKVEKYELTRNKDPANPEGELDLKPTSVKVSLHNPKEPANLRSNVFSIPLGHSTTVYVTPKAQQIDSSAKELTEMQRGCRLSEKTEKLDVFNIYTQEACLFECKMKQAVKRCGCFPWNYPVTEVSFYQISTYILNFQGKSFIL